MQPNVFFLDLDSFRADRALSSLTSDVNPNLAKIIKKGKDIWCCCPFHNEKTPSCKINDEQGSFYCFGCGAKGDIFTIYQDLFNYTFVDAVKELANKFCRHYTSCLLYTSPSPRD